MIEQELNRYWETVVNTIQDGVMIVDTDGTIVSVNKALESITGYSNDKLIGKPCTILNCNICEIAREGKGEKWCSLFRTGAVSKRKCALMKKDGVYIHVLKNASLLHDINGQVMGAVETMTDITELMEKDTQIEAFRRELQTENGFHGILGASASMQQVFDLISNASYSDAPVVIFGQSGTGKELVAKAIHDTGTRRKMPFLKVNCADMKKKQLIEALESADGNQSQAAEILGISRVTVWNRMKRYGITAQRRIDR